MALPVIWSDLAEETYEALLDQLIDHGNDRKATSLIDRTEEILLLIRSLPELFAPISKKSSVRPIILTKEINLYYRYENKRIEILLFHPSKSNPMTLKRLLSLYS
jgi:plasmid stabilization system protein ParE